MVSIWDVALQQLNVSDNADKVTDKYILFAGASSCGKTTAILKFLARDEPTRPTIALEYTFARKSSNMQNKMTGHIWELGGGTHLTKLVEVPINPDTLQHLTITIVIDLSAPDKLWVTLEGLINTTRERVEHVIKQVNKRDPNFSKNLKKATRQRLGFDKDKFEPEEIKPFPVPLVIIGSKYDLFQDMDFEEKKLIVGAMRCLAHCNGGTLLFTSSKIESTSKALRHVMNVAAFDGKLNKTCTIEDNKPIYIPAGMDNTENIGSPPKSLTSIRGTGKTFIDSWRAVFCNHFQQQHQEQQHELGGGEDPVREKQFGEAKVDEARLQKDRVLEAYRRQENQRWTSRIN